MSERDIPKMMEITSQGTPDTAEGVEKSLEEELEAFPSYRKYMYEMCDMGYWVLEEKESGTIVGRAGVEPKIWNHNSSVVELGYLIDEKHRRKGFAYEACRGILEEAKKRGLCICTAEYAVPIWLPKSWRASLAFPRLITSGG